MRTVIKLAGGGVPADRPIDGLDLRQALMGGSRSPRQMNFYYWDNELRAIRKGDYKAHFITSGAYGEGEPRRAHDTPLLFNLAEDPGERHDVASLHPDVVADLVREAEKHRQSVRPGPPLFDQLMPSTQPAVR